MFRPTTPGPKQTTLHVTFYQQLDQTFAVSGNAIAAPSTMYASMPDLYVKPQTFMSDQVFMIVNAGTSTVDMGQPVITGPFGQSPPGWNCPSPLTPGAACYINPITIGAPTASGCPMGTFTTTTGAVTVPLTARYATVVSTVTVGTPLYGSVLIDPPGQLCTSTGTGCTASFDMPTAVKLTAMPEAGGHFLGWYAQPAAACGSDPVCTLAAGFTSVQVAPRFASAQAKAIAVTIAGTGAIDAGYPGSCTASCTLYAEPGAQVILSESTTGSFTGWSGDCTGTQMTCNLGNVINDRAVTATFSP